MALVLELSILTMDMKENIKELNQISLTWCNKVHDSWKPMEDVAIGLYNIPHDVNTGVCQVHKKGHPPRKFWRGYHSWESHAKP